MNRKRNKVSMRIEKQTSDGRFAIEWKDYNVDHPEEYIKSTRARMITEERGERLLEIEINDLPYWKLDDTPKVKIPTSQPLF
jgi:hypothetical protein